MNVKVGVVIVTHYRLGEELLQALRLIVPDAPDFHAVSHRAQADASTRCAAAIAEALEAADKGEGVLILTDMFGGTPSNISLSFLDEHQVEVVTGRQPADADQARDAARGEAARGAGHLHQGLRPAEHLGGQRAAAGRRRGERRSAPDGRAASSRCASELGLHARPAGRFVAAGRALRGRDHASAAATSG